MFTPKDFEEIIKKAHGNLKRVHTLTACYDFDHMFASCKRPRTDKEIKARTMPTEDDTDRRQSQSSDKGSEKGNKQQGNGKSKGGKGGKGTKEHPCEGIHCRNPAFRCGKRGRQTKRARANMFEDYEDELADEDVDGDAMSEGNDE